MYLSVVIPVYKSEKTISILVEKLRKEIVGITNDFEIILVDDCCPQQSWSKIKEECKLDNRVKGIKLSKNFGQHYAISAGLKYVTGDWIVVMDCDLQDDPKNVRKLYEHANLNCSKIVFARRIQRKDDFIKRKTSYFFLQSAKLFN